MASFSSWREFCIRWRRRPNSSPGVRHRSGASTALILRSLAVAAQPGVPSTVEVFRLACIFHESVSFVSHTHIRSSALDTPPRAVVCVILIQTSQIDQSKVKNSMREIQSSEAKARLPHYLDEVERGETLVITRHGKPIAHLVPAPELDRDRVLRALEQISALRQTSGRMTRDEILAARHEGHKR